MAEKLTKGERSLLAFICEGYPEPVTINLQTKSARTLQDRDLILQWDMWPDGRVRYIATQAGLALAEGEQHGDR